MTKPINTDSIEKETGKRWEAWVKFLDKAGGRDLSHSAIAKIAYNHIVELGVFDDSGANKLGRQNSSGWWSQSVAVAYEQHIGRRAPGQRSDGTYEVSVTKVFGIDRADVMKWWLSKVKNRQEFNGIRIDGGARVSVTPVAHNWRVDLADGSKIVVSASERDSGKAMIAIAVQKLKNAKDVENWRSFWKQFLQE